MPSHMSFMRRGTGIQASLQVVMNGTWSGGAHILLLKQNQVGN